MKRVVIISGGDMSDNRFYRELVRETDFIICADGGGNNASKIDVWPDVLIGDLDSIDPQLFAHFKAGGIKIFSHPAEKDKTDTQLALDYALSLHPEEIVLTGTLGDRPDHSLANIFLLLRAVDADTPCAIIESRAEIRVVQKFLVLKGRPGDTVTVLPLGKAEGVSLAGVKYPLKGAVLDSQNLTLGVSNELKEARAVIKVAKGSLLVFKMAVVPSKTAAD